LFARFLTDMSIQVLAALEPAQRAVVVGIDLEFALRERLAAFGVRVGRTLQVLRRVGSSGPLQVRIGHTDLILRAAEAMRIRVELLTDDGP
jgi:ferrous iron transport protein A